MKRILLLSFFFPTLLLAFAIHGKGFFYGFLHALLYIGHNLFHVRHNLFHIGNNCLTQTFKGFIRFGFHAKKLMGFKVKGYGEAFQHFGLGEGVAHLNHGDIVGGYIGFFRKLFLGYALLPTVFLEISRQYFPDTYHRL